MADIIYTLTVPFPVEQTIDLISSVVSTIGKLKKRDTNRGYVVGKWALSEIALAFNKSVKFFIERGDTVCKVRAVVGQFEGAFYENRLDRTSFEVKRLDKFWDRFLNQLYATCPNTDFGAKAGTPYVVGVLHVEGDTEQIFTSRTTGGTSLLGFLAGGALFGEAGAIVGGMSGATHTQGKTNVQFSKYLLMRVVYSNGRIDEGLIKKKSNLYHEIMANMNSL